jgi:hypothetical protein
MKEDNIIKYKEAALKDSFFETSASAAGEYAPFY